MGVRQLLLKMTNLLSFVFPLWAIFTSAHGQATTTTITSTTITSATATTTTPSTTITTSTTNGTLQSPNFPNKYPNNHDETYNIEVQTGKTIEIIFETFELEAHSRCSYDWLKIIDGSTTLLEETCGSNVPTKLLSQTNKVEIIFHTDGSVTKRGFKLQWKASIETHLQRAFGVSGKVCQLNYCPYKMRQLWFRNFEDCCFHPVRRYLPKSYPYLHTAECGW